MQCRKCGYKQKPNGPEAMFCIRCGKVLRAKPKDSAKILDLRDIDSTKNAKFKRSYNPAQSLHTTLRQEIKPKNELIPREMQEKRLHRALSVKQHEKISKFGTQETHSTNALQQVSFIDHGSTTTPPKKLLPHTSYPISKKATNNQLVAEAMATLHDRYTPGNQQIYKNNIEHKSNDITSDERSEHSTLFQKLALIVMPPKRLLQVAPLVAIILVLATYISYLNYPNIIFRVAASRAGIEANLPTYRPTDYVLDKKGIAYKPGLVSVTFRSKANGTSVTVKQSETKLDSDSLMDQFVSLRDSTPDTVRQNGIVVYIYNGTDATWVNAGKQYIIEGNGLLEREQLLKIASSL